MPADEKSKFNSSGEIVKTVEDERIVYGFASVIEKDGEQVFDLQGDAIPEADLRKAAHLFVEESREGKVNHVGPQKGRVVESIVFTRDLQKALGIDLGLVGWFVGFKVDDAEAWEKVKSGELKAFSIGGTGTRRTVEGE